MTNNQKNIIVTILFISFITVILFLNIIKKDTLVSVTERRKLQEFPEFSVSKLLNGEFFEKFEKYTMDEFIQREMFRSLKINIELNVLNKLDYNNIYEKDGYLVEQLYPLNEKSIINVINKINYIKENYITENNNVYYTIIPDKNYYVNSNNLKLDYKKIEDIMSENLRFAEYINIFKNLNLDSYYYTDSHWKQNKLNDVVRTISNKMNLNINNKYYEKKLTKFEGVYAGRIPIKVHDDEIIVLTNDIIENSIVYNYETNKETKVYDMSKIDSYDKYDIYLSGATPLLTIENENSNINRELIVFRDSYGSSLIPLLIEAYSKITIIDTRYISPKILDQYVQFTNQDILFVYSTLLINNSSSLK